MSDETKTAFINGALQGVKNTLKQYRGMAKGALVLVDSVKNVLELVNEITSDKHIEALVLDATSKCAEVLYDNGEKITDYIKSNESISSKITKIEEEGLVNMNRAKEAFENEIKEESEETKQ